LGFDKRGERDIQVFEVKNPFGKIVRFVNIYNQRTQVGGEQSQGRPVHTARWKEIIEQDKILLEGD